MFNVFNQLIFFSRNIVNRKKIKCINGINDATIITQYVFRGKIHFTRLRVAILEKRKWQFRNLNITCLLWKLRSEHSLIFSKQVIRKAMICHYSQWRTTNFVMLNKNCFFLDLWNRLKIYRHSNLKKTQKCAISATKFDCIQQLEHQIIFIHSLTCTSFIQPNKKSLHDQGVQWNWKRRWTGPEPASQLFPFPSWSTTYSIRGLPKWNPRCQTGGSSPLQELPVITNLRFGLLGCLQLANQVSLGGDLGQHSFPIGHHWLHSCSVVTIGSEFEMWIFLRGKSLWFWQSKLAHMRSGQRKQWNYWLLGENVVGRCCQFYTMMPKCIAPLTVQDAGLFIRFAFTHAHNEHCWSVVVHRTVHDFVEIGSICIESVLLIL